MELLKSSVDSLGGSVIDLKPGAGVDEAFMRKGLSGAIVVTDIGGAATPVAMVIKVNTQTNTLRSMRFDYIKARFAEIWAQEEPRAETGGTVGFVPYRIISTSHYPLGGDLGVMGLQGNRGAGVLPLLLARARRTSYLRSKTPGGKSKAFRFSSRRTVRENRCGFGWTSGRGRARIGST